MANEHAYSGMRFFSLFNELVNNKDVGNGPSQKLVKIPRWIHENDSNKTFLFKNDFKVFAKIKIVKRGEANWS